MIAGMALGSCSMGMFETGDELEEHCVLLSEKLSQNQVLYMPMISADRMPAAGRT